MREAQQCVALTPESLEEEIAPCPPALGTSQHGSIRIPAYLTFSSYAALPAAVREEADQMQSLWNAMVDVYEVAHRQQERLHKQFLQTSRTRRRAAGGTRSIGDPFECIKQLRDQNDSLEDATLLALFLEPIAQLRLSTKPPTPQYRPMSPLPREHEAGASPDHQTSA